MNIRIVKFTVGVLLVLILFAHNFIFNLPQSLQDSIMQTHSIPITQFNLLYSLQTLPTIFLIIPLGVLYDSFGPKMLIPSACLLVLGQLLMFIYTPLRSSFSFIMMIMGRVMQGIGAEILYMGQGVLATKWMGSLVGLILVLPELGEICNAFLTPMLNIKGGLYMPLGLGFITCIISLIASVFLFYFDRKYERSLQTTEETSIEQPSQDINWSKMKEFSRLFWILIVICAIDESIYIPFMDNANTLIQIRFGIQYGDTGYYICIPFLSAISSTIIFGYLLKIYSKKKLALVSGILGIIAHTLIYILPNYHDGGEKNHAIISFCFFLFGFGLGSYYAVIYPLVGLAVKKEHQGTAYAIVSFVQALGMSVFPQISAFIIKSEANPQAGYKKSSIVFILAAVTGLIGCIYLCFQKSKIMKPVTDQEEKDVIYMKGLESTEVRNSDTPRDTEVMVEMSAQEGASN